MSDVTIYTTAMCGYCHAAKELLKRKDVDYHEIDVSFDPAMRAEMSERSGGRRTVPQIFIDGAHIGGCDELYALDKAGDLDELLSSAREGA